MKITKGNQEKVKNSKRLLKKIKKQIQGITLIALVVTVIVLLILAGVALSLTVGDNGLFRRAQNAADTWQMAEQNEQSEMEQAGEFINDYANNITRVDEVPIPNGFYYAGGSEETGLVISDNPADKKDWDEETATDNVSTNLQGNQFVWVPVDNPNELFTIVEDGIKLNGVEKTTNVFSRLKLNDRDGYIIGTPGNANSGIIREPDLLSSGDTSLENYKEILGFEDINEMADCFIDDYRKMADSIRKHSGFYIGRYEITGSLAKPTEKSGKVLTASNDEANNWYGLYNACKKIIQENRNVKSTMIYGVQWDAVCSWLSQSEYNTNTDSSEWGNYNGININTGSNTTYEANGIFDWLVTTGSGHKKQ